MNFAESLNVVLLKVRSCIQRIVPTVLGLLLLALVLVEVLQVSGRYLFGFGFAWVQPVLSLLLLTLGWLGGAYLWYARAHLNVELIPLPKNFAKRWSLPVADFLFLGMLMILLPAMTEAMSAYARLELEGLSIPASIKLLPCYCALVLIGIGAVLNLIECFLHSSVNSLSDA